MSVSTDIPEPKFDKISQSMAEINYYFMYCYYLYSAGHVSV